MSRKVRVNANPRSGYPVVNPEEALEKLRALMYLAGYDTSPENPNSEAEKDAKARQALQLAGSLIAPFVRWAINHEVGQLLRHVGPAVPWRPHRLENLKKYESRTRQRNLAANSHNNEREGASYVGGDPHLDRQVAAAVLGLISSGMDFRPGRELAGSLQALEQGEMTDMLKPARKGRVRGVSVDQIKLRSVEHVYFLVGQGKKKHEALKAVASAMRTSPETIDQWEKRLSKTVDRELIAERLESARMIGELAAALKNKNLRASFAGKIHMNFDNPQELAKAERVVEHFAPCHLDQLRERFKSLRAK